MTTMAMGILDAGVLTMTRVAMMMVIAWSFHVGSSGRTWGVGFATRRPRREFSCKGLALKPLLVPSLLSFMFASSRRLVGC